MAAVIVLGALHAFAQQVDFIGRQSQTEFFARLQQQARAAFFFANNVMDSHSLFLGKELYGKHNNSNRNHNLNDKRNQHRQQ